VQRRVKLKQAGEEREREEEGSFEMRYFYFLLAKETMTSKMKPSFLHPPILLIPIPPKCRTSKGLSSLSLALPLFFPILRDIMRTIKISRLYFTRDEEGV